MKILQHKFKILLVIALVFISFLQTLGRDINLDAIYIKKTLDYKKLISLKKDVYEIANSKKILNHTIFAHWISNDSIALIQEYNSVNILYLFNTKTRSRKEIKRFNGAIASVAFSNNGNTLLLKNIIIKENGFPETRTEIISITEKKSHFVNLKFPFIDATFSHNGKYIYYHKSGKGIIKYSAIHRKTKIAISINKYKNLLSRGNLTLAFPSPSNKKYILISGSGGNYKCKLIKQNAEELLPNCSSSSEVVWINNNEFLFQSGDPMNYRIFKYNLEEKKKIYISKKSLNTNLTRSKKNGCFSILENQIINIYIKGKKPFNTYLEGEDVYISPDKTKFLSLFMGNLYISNILTISKNSMKMHRILKNILDKYKTIYNDKSQWHNKYSKQYLHNKITTYKSLLIIK